MALLIFEESLGGTGKRVGWARGKGRVGGREEAREDGGNGGKCRRAR